MPPHHHHHHHRHQCSSCCCCCSCYCSSDPSSTPLTSPTDQLLQALASQLHPPPPPPPLPPLPISPTDQLIQALAGHLFLQAKDPKPQLHHPRPNHHQKDPLHHQGEHPYQSQSVLHSLLSRVSALESHLPHLSPPSHQPYSPPPPSPPPPPPPAAAAAPPSKTPATPAKPRPSLRDVAAQTIQARFRQYMVRRSQTLRQLKQLAAIKSHAATLRSSLSGKAQAVAFDSVSHRAMDLLLQLDSIQSCDPTIREGKRSISWELSRILDFIDKVSAKDHRMPLDGPGSDPRSRVPRSNAAKRVSFAGNGNESRSATGADVPLPEEESIDAGDPVEDHPEGFGMDYGGTVDYSRISEEDEGGAAHLGPEGIRHHHPGEDESILRAGMVENGVRMGIGRKSRGQNGNPDLSAPMPVHMEPRAWRS